MSSHMLVRDTERSPVCENLSGAGDVESLAAVTVIR